MNQFEEALGDGDTRTVRRMLRENPDLLEQPNKYGSRPLMTAVGGMGRTLGCVKALLDAGADVNAKTPEGYTALHCAVDVDGPTGHGKSPERFIRLLAGAGAHLEARQHWGWTPLMRAVIEGKDDEVRALLAVGADPNAAFPDNTLPVFMRGFTVLMMAANDSPKLTLLLEAGADAGAKGHEGRTALDYAQGLLAEATREEYKAEVTKCIRILEDTQQTAQQSTAPDA